VSGSNKVVLITGCSTGIGRDCAKRLSLSGYAVAATARRPDTLADLPAALKLELDVTNGNSINNAVNMVVQKLGRIDILINNAGFGLNSTIEEIPEETLREMYDVNVFGVIRMIKAVLPVMHKNKSGRIVNIGSIVGKLSTPVNGLYSSTKYALEALSDSLRLELAAFGIKVILIEPGSIMTNFHKNVNLHTWNISSNKDSIYHELYKNFDRFISSARGGSAGPEAVSYIIQKAIEASNPRARYRANVPFLMNILIGLGDRQRDFLIKTALKIKNLKNSLR
jgi:NADP-dependent 3-hydroxy acid dehydrogenase YdfG